MSQDTDTIRERRWILIPGVDIPEPDYFKSEQDMLDFAIMTCREEATTWVVPAEWEAHLSRRGNGHIIVTRFSH